MIRINRVETRSLSHHPAHRSALGGSYVFLVELLSGFSQRILHCLEALASQYAVCDILVQECAGGSHVFLPCTGIGVSLIRVATQLDKCSLLFLDTLPLFPHDCPQSPAQFLVQFLQVSLRYPCTSEIVAPS